MNAIIDAIKLGILGLSLMLLTESVSAGEVTGAGKRAMEALRAANISLQQLKESGHELLLGEVTGGGKKLDLDRVKIVITKKKAFDLDNATHIQFKHPSEAKSLEDVELLEFDKNKVKTEEIESMVIKK